MAHMAGVGQRPHAVLARCLGDRFAIVELAARNHHMGAALRERQRHRAAEAATAAGDQSHLAVEIERVLHAIAPLLPLLADACAV